MDELWRKLEGWLSVYAPSVFNALNAGATEEEIDAVEQHIGISVPDDFRQSYRIHNGSKGYGLAPFPASEFLSLGQIAYYWNLWNDPLNDGAFATYRSEPSLGVRDDWYNKHWIPFAVDAYGILRCLDLDPADGGTVGQVIMLFPDEPERDIIAPSFRAYMEQTLSALQCGEYVYSAKNGGIWFANEL